MTDPPNHRLCRCIRFSRTICTMISRRRWDVLLNASLDT